MNITASDNNFYELTAALEGYDLVAVKRLVQSPHCAINDSDNRGFTPLHYACAAGFHESLDDLLNCGADPNLPDVNGETPLHFVCSSFRDVEHVQPLLNHGANIALTDPYGQTALHMAAAQELDCPAIVQLLIDSGAQVDVRDCRQQTPLHCAAVSGNVENVQTLLAGRADPRLGRQRFATRTFVQYKLLHPPVKLFKPPYA